MSVACLNPLPMKNTLDKCFEGLLRAIERVLRWCFPHAAIMLLPAGRYPELRDSRTEPLLYRAIIAHMYIRGEGIEIGGLHQPLHLPAWAKVKYVDRMTVEDLRRHYPEFTALPLVPVDIIDDGQTLGHVADASQDFVIANSILEHFPNPLLCIENMLRVLKAGGMLYMALPDKRFIFDRKRETTSYAHLLADYRAGTPDDEPHFREWVKVFFPNPDRAVEEAKVRELRETGYSIHYHAWTQAEIFDLIAGLQRDLGLHFHVKLVYSCNDEESVVVLQKQG